MAQNVKVYCRVRPLLASEKVAGARPCIAISEKSSYRSDRSLQGAAAGSADNEQKPYVRVGDRSWAFDGVFGIDSKQQDIFDDTVSPLVESCLAGYNATILAYGQTGSGKTFTMGTANPYASESMEEIGGGGEMVEEQTMFEISETDGIIPRALRDLFQLVQHKRQSGVVVDVSVSYLEILNEEIRDLLAVESSPSKQLAVREDNYRRIVVQGSVTAKASSLKETLNLFNIGGSRRTTAGTLMNAASSRSHAIFTVFIDQHGDGVSRRRVRSKFHLVDLAGSERLVRTGATGARQRESAAINQGLLALSKVISALTVRLRADDTRHQHVPYRDSKLTRLLQDSLGGNSATCVVACISPADNSIGETVNTLKYASKARLIINEPIVNEVDEEEILRERQIQKKKPHGEEEEGEEEEASTLERGRRGEGKIDQAQIENMKEMLAESQSIFMKISSSVRLSLLSASSHVDTEPMGGKGTTTLSHLQAILKLSEEGSQIGNKSLKRGNTTSTPSLGDKYMQLNTRLENKDKEIQFLMQENKLLKDDLSRDEEIFAEKLREIRSLQNELVELKKEAQSAASEGKENDRQVWKVEDMEEEHSIASRNGLASSRDSEVSKKQEVQRRSIHDGNESKFQEVEISAPSEIKECDDNTSGRRLRRKKWGAQGKSGLGMLEVTNAQPYSPRRINDENDGESKKTNALASFERRRNELEREEERIKTELLECEGEVRKLKEDAYEGEAALLDAQNEQLETRQKYDAGKKLINQAGMQLAQISESIMKLDYELKNKVEHADRLEQELALVRSTNEASRHIPSSAYGSADSAILVKKELEQVLAAIKDHRSAIQELEKSSEEATQLVLRYRNRVVGLQQEVGSLRSELLKESDAKLHQTANTSRAEADLSKQRTAKLKELLNMRTTELRTLALQENEQKKVLSLKKDSDTRSLKLKSEINILEAQAKEKEKFLSSISSNHEASSSRLHQQSDELKIQTRRNIESKLQELYAEIKSIEKQLKRLKMEKKELEEIKKNHENDLFENEASLKQAIRLVDMTQDACSVVNNAIHKLDASMGVMKNRLLEIEDENENIQKEEIEEASRFGEESRGNTRVKEQGWREDSDGEEDSDESSARSDYGSENKSADDIGAVSKNKANGFDESKDEVGESRVEGWFNALLDNAEMSILELQRHSRNVFLREIAKRKWMEVENERISMLNSQAKMRASDESIHKVLTLRSSLEEVNATIKALDAQLAITNQESSKIKLQPPSLPDKTNIPHGQGRGQQYSNLVAPCSSDGSSEYSKLSHKLEFLAIRREEALEKKSQLESKVVEEGGSNSVETESSTLQQINDELYALEAEIDLKDIEIRRWKRKESLSNASKSCEPHNSNINSFSSSQRHSSIISEQVENCVMKEVKSKLMQKRNRLLSHASSHIGNGSSASLSHDHLDVNNDSEVAVLFKCLYTASMECLKYRLRLKDSDLIVEDLSSKVTQFEIDMSMLNRSLKTQKDNFNELSRKYKSVSFNLMQVRNERNQLKTFLSTATSGGSGGLVESDVKPETTSGFLEVGGGDDDGGGGGGSVPRRQILSADASNVLGISHTDSTSLNRDVSTNHVVPLSHPSGVRKVRMSAKGLKELSQVKSLTPKAISSEGYSEHSLGQRKGDSRGGGSGGVGGSNSRGSGGGNRGSGGGNSRSGMFLSAPSPRGDSNKHSASSMSLRSSVGGASNVDAPSPPIRSAPPIPPIS